MLQKKMFPNKVSLNYDLFLTLIAYFCQNVKIFRLLQESIGNARQRY